MERLMLLLLQSSSVEWIWVIRSEREFCSSDPSEIWFRKGVLWFAGSERRFEGEKQEK
ncbi:hypothetical protein Peur_016599 [Populus x canadensis]